MPYPRPAARPCWASTTSSVRRAPASLRRSSAGSSIRPVPTPPSPSSVCSASCCHSAFSSTAAGWPHRASKPSRRRARSLCSLPGAGATPGSGWHAVCIYPCGCNPARCRVRKHTIRVRGHPWMRCSQRGESELSIMETVRGDPYRDVTFERHDDRWVHWPVHWTPVWVGVLTALATALLIGLVATAIGAHEIGPSQRVVTYKDIRFGALVFGGLGAFLSFFAGGWVARRVAGIRSAEPA